MLKETKSHSKDFHSLSEWLCYLETIHSFEIDLGLSRISQVAQRLAIDLSFAQVITVAGTNGKGTTCAFLEHALLAETIKDHDNANTLQQVAVYSSPHIEHFNERLRINKCDVDDEAFIAAFEQIEQARAEISLSYYEYTTLAAFLVMMAVKPDVIILEVGLGGRLDATNIIDADVAIITSIDLDHQAFLGDDRESIGFEKAGIMRADQHIIIGDLAPPQSMLSHAQQINEAICNDSSSTYTDKNRHANSDKQSRAQTNRDNHSAINKIKVRNKDFYLSSKNTSEQQLWQWHCVDNAAGATEFQLTDLVPTHIPQDNVATALMALKQLGVKLTTDKVNALIEKTKVAGRTELFSRETLHARNISCPCDVMLDVAHNPHAGRYLAKKITQCCQQKTYTRIIAVVAMLADKDIANTLLPLTDIIDQWYIASLDVPRAANIEQMTSNLAPFAQSINCFDNISQAFKMASNQAQSTDLILVFGSFFTVAEIRKLLI
ncbi:bifunctional tetrahydrofolate synthase/dihydrofolate synthase [Colwellia sp. KU-HH00111]|uniref:bifunctional tetrahydrofolate synthase/dihydrofolate synthase n=1 Tax=Colwellia sp. KU-HH00111 TaxID=3127652 RepID=UPI0031057AD1